MQEMDYNKIGEFIRETRIKRGLTQDQLAEKLYLTRKSISKWEVGYFLPSTSYLFPLCEALDISMDELLNAKLKKKDNLIYIQILLIFILFILRIVNILKNNKILIICYILLSIITFSISLYKYLKQTKLKALTQKIKQK